VLFLTARTRLGLGVQNMHWLALLKPDSACYDHCDSQYQHSHDFGGRLIIKLEECLQSEGGPRLFPVVKWGYLLFQVRLKMVNFLRICRVCKVPVSAISTYQYDLT
jgi:hypothetical protein